MGGCDALSPRHGLQVRLDFLPNLDGVFIVDRTVTGPLPGVRFKPSPDNIGWAWQSMVHVYEPESALGTEHHAVCTQF
jgi:hypothetical protein